MNTDLICRTELTHITSVVSENETSHALADTPSCGEGCPSTPCRTKSTFVVWTWLHVNIVFFFISIAS